MMEKFSVLSIGFKVVFSKLKKTNLFFHLLFIVFISHLFFGLLLVKDKVDLYLERSIYADSKLILDPAFTSDDTLRGISNHPVVKNAVFISKEKSLEFFKKKYNISDKKLLKAINLPDSVDISFINDFNEKKLLEFNDYIKNIEGVSFVNFDAINKSIHKKYYFDYFCQLTFAVIIISFLFIFCYKIIKLSIIFRSQFTELADFGLAYSKLYRFPLFMYVAFLSIITSGSFISVKFILNFIIKLT